MTRQWKNFKFINLTRFFSLASLGSLGLIVVLKGFWVETQWFLLYVYFFLLTVFQKPPGVGGYNLMLLVVDIIHIVFCFKILQKKGCDQLFFKSSKIWIIINVDYYFFPKSSPISSKNKKWHFWISYRNKLKKIIVRNLKKEITHLPI